MAIERGRQEALRKLEDMNKKISAKEVEIDKFKTLTSEITELKEKELHDKLAEKEESFHERAQTRDRVLKKRLGSSQPELDRMELQRKLEVVTAKLKKATESYEALSKEYEEEKAKKELADPAGDVELRKSLARCQEALLNEHKISLKAEEEIKSLLNRQREMEAQMAALKKKHNSFTKEIFQLSLRLPSFGFGKNRGKEKPPPKGELSIVFTDVQGSTKLWEHDPEMMFHALEIHNDIIRIKIKEHNGYEVKTEGDSFMVAFRDSINAVSWCLEVQEELLKANWPEEILKHKDAKVERDPKGILLYRGLRVRMGVHRGEPKAKEDPVTGTKATIVE